VRAGERPDCDLVVPGLGEQVELTAGARLHVPPGLSGEIHVGDRVVPATAGDALTLAPGDRAILRVAAHPEVVLELHRVARERLSWSTRFHGRDLVRQLVTGAALMAMIALLWRVERVENVLAVRGDPLAEDSPLLRVMFAPTEDPIEVIRARELFAVRHLPPPPPDAGADALTSAPAPIAFTREGPVEVEPPAPELAEPAEIPSRLRSKKARRARGAELPMPVVLSEPPLGLLSEPRAVDALSGIDDGIGGIVGGVVGSSDLGSLLPMQTGSLRHVEEGMFDGPVAAAPVGVHAHGASGAEVTRGARDGLAAAGAPPSCADPEIVRKTQIDVVFVIDVSTTMNFMLGKIHREIAAVDAAVRAHQLDARYGLVVFVDDVQVTNGGQPFADLAALQRELAAWQAFTASNRQIGSEAQNLDWPENSLDALHAAAREFAWRPAATTLRAVVHATDDDFGEAPAVQSGQRVRHTYRQTVDALRAAEVRVFSFAARIGGQCECLDVSAGLFGPYRGQKAIPAATGGAVFDIDEVAAGRLDFGAAVSGALKTAVCTHYPLSPVGR
ncbi:MAG TPA: vWA domain-containing protein, partial [Nannocystis sp.]